MDVFSLQKLSAASFAQQMQNWNLKTESDITETMHFFKSVPTGLRRIVETELFDNFTFYKEDFTSFQLRSENLPAPILSFPSEPTILAWLKIFCFESCNTDWLSMKEFITPLIQHWYKKALHQWISVCLKRKAHSALTHVLEDAIWKHHHQLTAMLLNVKDDKGNPYIILNSDITLDAFSSCTVPLIQKMLQDHIPDGYLTRKAPILLATALSNKEMPFHVFITVSEHLLLNKILISCTGSEWLRYSSSWSLVGKENRHKVKQMFKLLRQTIVYLIDDHDLDKLL